MNDILYIGEIKDYSDQWLISVLKEQHPVIVADIAEYLEPKRNSSILINRLYTSAIERFGQQRIMDIVAFITETENNKTLVINSSQGFTLDMSRKEQFVFFRNKNIPFIETRCITSAAQGDNANSFPYVLKHNSSGRNKSLKIINSKKEILEFSDQTRNNSVLQPLIKQNICYRTEFVGYWDTTFTQHVSFDRDKLDFGYNYDIVPTPLPRHSMKLIRDTLNQVGIQVFSIEYFMKKDKLLNIVDFNLTSNYPLFLIEKIGDHLGNAWLNLIK